jgi:hypothetical protein
MKHASTTIRGAAAFAVTLGLAAPTLANRASTGADIPPRVICGRQVADKLGEAFKSGPETEIRYWIAIINAHLYAADKLVEAGRAEEAMPHLLHPLEEVVPNIGPLLQRFGLSDIGGDLVQLKEALPNPDFQPKLESIVKKLAAALERMPIEDRVSLERNAEIVAALVEQSSKEFDEAWVGLKIKNLVEYQDAAGFHREAKMLFAQIKDQLDQKNSKGATAIEKAMNDMAKAWPALDPPEKPEYAASAVRGLARVVQIHLLRSVAAN